MSEWWTYSLSDYLLFSPRVYYRLFELHNTALWPVPLLTVAVGLLAIAFLARPNRATSRAIPVIFGVLWIWIAWAFFRERYATINWAAPYVAAPFALEGLLLILCGLVKRNLAFDRSRDICFFAILALLAFAVVGYPFIAPLMDRPLRAAEVFGIAPDPTAVATLAILSLLQDRARWMLMVVPLLWCAVTGATLWAMQSGDFLLAPLCALLALGLGIVKRVRQ